MLYLILINSLMLALVIAGYAYVAIVITMAVMGACCGLVVATAICIIHVCCGSH